MCTKFWSENLKGRDILEEPEYCSRLSGIGWEGVDGIHLAQDWGLVASSCEKGDKTSRDVDRIWTVECMPQGATELIERLCNFTMLTA